MSQDQNGKRDYNDLQDWAKQVALLPSIEDKKLVALDIIDNFEFKSKVAKFKHLIENARTGDKIDQTVFDIVLASEGLGTIKSKAFVA